MKSIYAKEGESFSFSCELDCELLEELYLGDLAYAIAVFELFLTHTFAETRELRPLIEQEKWNEVSKLAHKLKPTFSMVGLPKLELKMLEVEETARQERNVKSLSMLLWEVEGTLRSFRPILEAELEKMRKMLKVV